MPASKRTAKPKPPPDPNKLVREAAGSYRTGDGRFMVRQDHGGKWYATDTEQTNELGLELVIGPFGTIADARAALEDQREHPAGASPGAAIRSALPRIARTRKSASVDDGTRGATGVGARKDLHLPARHQKPDARPEPKPQREAEPEPEPRVETDYRAAQRHPTGDERDAVADAVRRINEAWAAGTPERMRDLLDSDVVFVQPGFTGRIEGRDAAISSYADFIANAVVHAYAESELRVDLRGHTAVASYRFEIDFERDGRRRTETGRDLFVFDRFGTRWRAVWRLQLPESDERGPGENDAS